MGSSTTNQRTWSDRLLGRTSFEQFIRVTKWSMVLMLPMPTCFAGFGLVQLGGQMTWQRWTTVALAMVVLVVSVWLTPRTLDINRGLREPQREKQILLTGVVVTTLWAAATIPIQTNTAWSCPASMAVLCAIPGLTVLSLLLPSTAAAYMTVPAQFLLAWGITMARGQHPIHVLLCALGPLFYGVLWVAMAKISLWMLQVVDELQRARETSARLAVAEERLRFSRDLHDVVGRSLSAVAVKSQLAAELARRGRTEQAIDEMLAVHQIADTSLTEMRQVVASMRRADLSRELDAARSMLSSAGVTLTVRGATADSLPEPASEGFAWAVRETVTNVVRHSRATRCSITIEQANSHVLTVWNDGVTELDGPAGTGLMGLTERLAAIGGTLSADRSGTEFTVQVMIPRITGASGTEQASAAHPTTGQEN